MNEFDKSTVILLLSAFVGFGLFMVLLAVALRIAP